MVFQFIFVAIISLATIYLFVSLIKSLWLAMECLLAFIIATLSWILLNQLEAIFTEFQERALTRRDQLVDYEMKRTMVSSDKD